ncbi:hypothetical protein GYMLUDRAFT_436712 [Collybiopsis luxurians FD-317 M1]|uniref:Uncharacterized protein n=1 Tax=Collybiopsis luxurians FD-317 M1 TaxID=944289 RepID=A0A0D0C7P5_9AGAR|nr:hypothetical protein GYMLUDRAFT_436712 [Collybiopsis luxurians FD-317 M1]
MISGPQPLPSSYDPSSHKEDEQATPMRIYNIISPFHPPSCPSNSGHPTRLHLRFGPTWKKLEYSLSKVAKLDMPARTVSPPPSSRHFVLRNSRTNALGFRPVGSRGEEWKGTLLASQERRFGFCLPVFCHAPLFFLTFSATSKSKPPIFTRSRRLSEVRESG